jgi:hypothetical protein
MPSTYRCNYDQMQKDLNLAINKVRVELPGNAVPSNYHPVMDADVRYHSKLYRLCKKKMGRFVVLVKEGSTKGHVFVHEDDLKDSIEYWQAKEAQLASKLPEPSVVEPPMQAPMFGHDEILQALDELRKEVGEIKKTVKMLALIASGTNVTAVKAAKRTSGAFFDAQ